MSEQNGEESSHVSHETAGICSTQCYILNQNPVYGVIWHCSRLSVSRLGSFYRLSELHLWLLKTWERYQGWSNMTLYLSDLAQGDSVQYLQHESALYSDIWRTKLQCWDSCDSKLCHNTASNSKMSSCYARLIMLFLNYISIKRYSNILALYLALWHPSVFFLSFKAYRLPTLNLSPLPD